MILYHGTNADFDTIDLNKTKPYKDFGRGFYVTEIRDQALDLARKRSDIWEGSPVVQEYQFDEGVLESGELKVLRFDRPSKESLAHLRSIL